ncbi:ribosomal RNA small subunit methyltransferase A [Candidatus Saccharibacteria bacterium]|nr:ribosomal RNA small subunit methyltransferase A [Candidatus Saccharibacteria bacterium]
MALQNNKSLGQHWLKDRQILDEIAELALGDASEDVSEETRTCIEIGPGLGFLTSSLLKLFPKVIAVEYDEKLAKNLPGSFPGKNLEVVHADFLNCDLESMPRPYVVAGNIPYYITSPIIMKLLETKNHPDRIVLLIQKEVAERIAAGKGKHTFLSIAVQNLADVSLGPVVTKEYFTPPPKVDSQVIILDPKEKPVISEQALELAKRGFSAPRKKLARNLSPFHSIDSLKSALTELNLSTDVRPADLSLEDWQNLYKLLAE